jgi:hypothetical protein
VFGHVVDEAVDGNLGDVMTGNRVQGFPAGTNDFCVLTPFKKDRSRFLSDNGDSFDLLLVTGMNPAQAPMATPHVLHYPKIAVLKGQKDI